MLEFTIETAKKAGAAVKKYFHEKLTISTKSTDRDLVTKADLESEKIILNSIKKNFPKHAVLSEEKGRIGTSEYIWVVDPIDGTTNFAHKYPIFSIAIALIKRGQIILSVTLDPMQDEIFAAEKRKGATLNGQPIHVSECNSISSALIATGFPYDRETNPRNNLDEFGKIMPRVQGIRRSGSAALDLAYVACGRLDGYWEFHLRSWDFAGGALLVEEAGGYITDVNKAPVSLESTSLIAGTAPIHQALFNAIHDKSA